MLKTFNVGEEVYRKFSLFCKDRGMSMSKQVDFFMRSVVEEELQVREEYIAKLNKIRKQKSIHIGGLDDFKKRYKIK